MNLSNINNLVELFFKQFENQKDKKKVLLSSLKDKKMKKLNRKFRNKNKTTDVLSFPALEVKELKLIKEKKIYIGDIAASFEIINLRSKKSNFSLEFDKVWVHGLLHLIGHDHIRNKDYFKMYKTEKRIVNLI